MANNKYTILLFVLLAACGGGARQDTGGGSYDYWIGGVIGVWEPASPVGVMILHQGHDCFSSYTCLNNSPAKQHDLERVRKQFVAAGLIVYGVEMPTGPHTDGPIDRYLQPALDAVNSASVRYPGLPIYMSGLSGGSWTTMMLSAYDSRITHGYAVEGDGTGSHWEDQNPILPHTEIYGMVDRYTYIAIPNSGGPCPLNTAYRCVNDYSVSEHTFSDWSVDYILSDLNIR